MTVARHGRRCLSGLETTLGQMRRRKQTMPRSSRECTSSPIHNPNTHTPHHHAPCTLITSTFLTLLPGSNLAQLTPSRRNRRSAKRTLTSTARRTRDFWPRRPRRRHRGRCHGFLHFHVCRCNHRIVVTNGPRSSPPGLHCAAKQLGLSLADRAACSGYAGVSIQRKVPGFFTERSSSATAGSRGT